MVIPLKGASLINRSYPLPVSDPMQDSTCLFMTGTGKGAKQVMLTAGNRPLSDLPEKWVKGFHFHAAFFLPGREVVVEVHWNLTDEHLLPFSKWQALWDRAYFQNPPGPGFWLMGSVSLPVPAPYKHGTFNAVLARQPNLMEFLLNP